MVVRATEVSYAACKPDSRRKSSKSDVLLKGSVRALFREFPTHPSVPIYRGTGTFFHDGEKIKFHTIFFFQFPYIVIFYWPQDSFINFEMSGQKWAAPVEMGSCAENRMRARTFPFEGTSAFELSSRNVVGTVEKGRSGETRRSRFVFFFHFFRTLRPHLTCVTVGVCSS